MSDQLLSKEEHQALLRKQEEDAIQYRKERAPAKTENPISTSTGNSGLVNYNTADFGDFAQPDNISPVDDSVADFANSGGDFDDSGDNGGDDDGDD